MKTLVIAMLMLLTTVSSFAQYYPGNYGGRRSYGGGRHYNQGRGSVYRNHGARRGNAANLAWLEQPYCVFDNTMRVNGVVIHRFEESSIDSTTIAFCHMNLRIMNQVGSFCDANVMYSYDGNPPARPVGQFDSYQQCEDYLVYDLGANKNQ